MTLTEISQISTWDLPIEQLKAHLRLGTGFNEDDVQNEVLEHCLRSAVAAIEARTGKALFNRGFRWVVHGWRSPYEQGLPIAPVTEILSLTVVTRSGDEAPVALDCFRLIEDSQRPLLRAVCSSLPGVPTGGQIELRFMAGFSADWTGLPADLGRAVLLLAAFYYERRAESPENDGNMPFGVSSLIDRYRTVRILGGARA